MYSLVQPRFPSHVIFDRRVVCVCVTEVEKASIMTVSWAGEHHLSLARTENLSRYQSCMNSVIIICKSRAQKNLSRSQSCMMSRLVGVSAYALPYSGPPRDRRRDNGVLFERVQRLLGVTRAHAGRAAVRCAPNETAIVNHA